MGPTDQFHTWVQWLDNSTRTRYGIEFTSRIGKEVEFLDILISFDRSGIAITDLFVKPTDARRCLSPDSCYPGHTLYGVVYSQGLRIIRRIVSNEDKLQSRLDELTDAFIASGYNKGSVKRILDKIAAKPRVLSYNKKNRNDKIIVPWVITYGPGVEETRSFVQHGSKILNKSSTWKDTGG